MVAVVLCSPVHERRTGATGQRPTIQHATNQQNQLDQPDRPTSRSHIFVVTHIEINAAVNTQNVKENDNAQNQKCKSTSCRSKCYNV